MIEIGENLGLVLIIAILAFSVTGVIIARCVRDARIAKHTGEDPTRNMLRD